MTPEERRDLAMQLPVVRQSPAHLLHRGILEGQKLTDAHVMRSLCVRDAELAGKKILGFITVGEANDGVAPEFLPAVADLFPKTRRAA